MFFRYGLLYFGYPALIALNLHLSLQVPHLIHLVVSMKWASFRSPMIASTGQLREQRVHPTHSCGSIRKDNNALHFPAGHL